MMNKFFASAAAATLLFSIACKNEAENKTAQHQGHEQAPATRDENKGEYSIELKTSPAAPKAEEQVELSFAIKNAKGEAVKELEIVHEKPLHLLVVSSDLAEFFHLHPEPQADGSLKMQFAFKNGGRYKLYADFKPKGSPAQVKTLDLDVSGPPGEKEALAADEKLEKTIGGIRVLMKPDAELASNRDVNLDFSVFDARTGELATGLQKYLGESAHFVIISEDLKEFVHAHPMSRDAVKSGQAQKGKDGRLMNAPEHSMVSAHVKFPKAGLYKIWAQFQRNGGVIDVPFVVSVKEGSKEGAKVSNVAIPEGAFKIAAGKDGFIPNEVSLKQKPVKLAFIREEEGGCADEVVFKDYGIRKKLPLGEVVVVDIENPKSEAISFSCGMDMFKGKVLVE